MGNLRIMSFDPKENTYSVQFAPYQSGGGAVGDRKFQERDGLKKYLLELNIHEDTTEKAFKDLGRDERCDIPNVSWDS
jgi:hypothetical protein